MCIPVLRVSGPPRKVILRLLLLLRSASTVLLLLLALLLVLLLLRITSSTKTVATTPTCTCTSTTASTYATIILPTGHISTTIIVRLSPIELPPPATPPPPTPWRGGWTMGWDGGATQHVFTVFQGTHTIMPRYATWVLGSIVWVMSVQRKTQWQKAGNEWHWPLHRPLLPCEKQGGNVMECATLWHFPPTLQSNTGFNVIYEGSHAFTMFCSCIIVQNSVWDTNSIGKPVRPTGSRPSR